MIAGFFSRAAGRILDRLAVAIAKHEATPEGQRERAVRLLFFFHRQERAKEELF